MQTRLIVLLTVSLISSSALAQPVPERQERPLNQQYQRMQDGTYTPPPAPVPMRDTEAPRDFTRDSFSPPQGGDADGYYVPTLTPKTANGISYITGGVGEMEKKMLDEMGASYSLKMLLTEKGGAFISDSQVVITSGDAQITSFNSDGPYAYVQLAPGKYSVSVTFNGVTQTRNVAIGKKQTNVHMTW